MQVPHGGSGTTRRAAVTRRGHVGADGGLFPLPVFAAESEDTEEHEEHESGNAAQPDEYNLVESLYA